MKPNIWESVTVDKATARPWKLDTFQPVDIYSGKKAVATCHVVGDDRLLTEEHMANAALIVKAVNRDHAFEGVLEGLKDAVQALRLAPIQIKAATNISWLEGLITEAEATK